MSLLGGMIAGAVSGGANAAYDMSNQTIDNNRKTAADELAFKRETALEQMRTQTQIARDDISYSRQTEQRLQDREWAESDWEKKSAHDMRIAGMNRSSSAAPKLDPRVDLLNKDIDRLSKSLTEGMLDDNQRVLVEQQLNEALQMRNQLAGLPFGGGSTTNPLLADLLAGGAVITDPDADDIDTPDATDTTTANTARNQPQSTPEPKPGLLGLSQEQIQANPSVQRLVEGREESNSTMARQLGNFKDRFFNKDMQESEQVAFQRFGDRVPLGDPEWEQWLSQNYPEVYQRRVERGEIKP